jgi:polar amino acid transport system permease protein
VAENLRGAVQSVPAGQMEAAKAIGLNFPKRVWYVIVPQAVRRVLPPWVNTCLEIVKGTTLLSVIGVVELLLANQQVIARNYMVIDFYMMAAMIYIVVNFSISQLGALLERRFSYIRY